MYSDPYLTQWWAQPPLFFPHGLAPGDADALPPSDEEVGVMRFVEFPGLPAGETVVEELTENALGETEDVWVLLGDTLGDTVAGAEEETFVLTEVNIRKLDGDGATATVVVKEITGANEADDATAVEADDGINKEVAETSSEIKNILHANLKR